MCCFFGGVGWGGGTVCVLFCNVVDVSVSQTTPTSFQVPPVAENWDAFERCENIHETQFPSSALLHFI